MYFSIIKICLTLLRNGLLFIMTAWSCVNISYFVTNNNWDFIYGLFLYNIGGYFAKRTAENTSLHQFEATFPTNLTMITRWQHKELIFLIAKKASWNEYEEGQKVGNRVTHQFRHSRNQWSAIFSELLILTTHMY